MPKIIFKETQIKQNDKKKLKTLENQKSDQIVFETATNFTLNNLPPADLGHEKITTDKLLRQKNNNYLIRKRS